MSDFTLTLIGFVIFMIMLLFMYKKTTSDRKKDSTTFSEIEARYPNVSTSHKENTHTYNILWMLFMRDKVAMLEAYPYIGMFWYTGQPHLHYEVDGTSLDDIMRKRPRMPLQHLIVNGISTGFHVVSPEPYIVVDEYIINKGNK